MTTVSALSEAVKSNFLELSGGTMTGSMYLNESNSFPILGATDNGRFHICAAPNWDRGAHLVLNGKTKSNYEGQFSLVAHNGTKGASFEGYPDGTLFWDGCIVERVNSHGWNYLRLESGTQFCWGDGGTGDNGGAYITYPVPFSGHAPLLLAQIGGGMNSSGTHTLRVENINASSFNVWSYWNGGLNRGIGFYWCAIGRWK